MAETSQITFSYKEVVTALLKQQDIHEGLWALYIEFGLSAANVGPSPEDFKPSAIIPVMKIGILKVEKLDSISVDAAVTNPA